MGSGNIDVGNATPTRKPGQPIGVRPQTSPNLRATRRALVARCRSRAATFRGNVSAPQKFVQLVGCREPKAEPGLEARQYSNPVKR